MTPERILAEFRAADALMEGHFVLSSGLHSPLYLQCARVLMDPARAERLCKALADTVRAALGETGMQVELCVSPALGGVVVGYETARQLGVPSVFAERVAGRFAFRRGFQIPKGADCLVVEDVVTTGGAVKECVRAVVTAGGRVPLAAALINRSGGNASPGAPLVSLLELDAPTYCADALPSELAALPVESPGSRRLQA